MIKSIKYTPNFYISYGIKHKGVHIHDVFISLFLSHARIYTHVLITGYYNG